VVVVQSRVTNSRGVVALCLCVPCQFVWSPNNICTLLLFGVHGFSTQTFILESVWYGICTYAQEPALHVFSDAVYSFERGGYVEPVGVHASTIHPLFRNYTSASQ
jgi:hypothetical protein